MPLTLIVSGNIDPANRSRIRELVERGSLGETTVAFDTSETPERPLGFHYGEPPSLTELADALEADEPVDQAAFPVTIYISEEASHEKVEAEVESWLATAGLEFVERSTPVMGSWFRSFRVALKNAMSSDYGHEAARVAVQAVDSRVSLAKNAEVTSTLFQNLAPVILSIQPYENAVIRAGSLLIVKIGEVLTVHQLTASQQLDLDHQPGLARSPEKILEALGMTTPSIGPSQGDGT